MSHDLRYFESHDRNVRKINEIPEWESNQQHLISFQYCYSNHWAIKRVSKTLAQGNNDWQRFGPKPVDWELLLLLIKNTLVRPLKLFFNHMMQWHGIFEVIEELRA